MSELRVPVILLVEDNPVDVKLTMRALQQSKVANTLVVAQNGREALDYLSGAGPCGGGTPRDMPTLILLDLKLPEIDGLSVLHRIRCDDRTRCLPVVILTSSREEQDIIKSYTLGANSYICKPVDFDQFVDAAKQLGVYWLALNEPPPVAKR